MQILTHGMIEKEKMMREMATIFIGELVKCIAILFMVYVFIKVYKSKGGK